jgi:hypothetical protein
MAAGVVVPVAVWVVALVAALGGWGVRLMLSLPPVLLS